MSASIEEPRGAITAATTQRDAPAAEQPASAAAKRRRRVELERYGTIAFFIGLFAIVTIFQGSEFFSKDNITLVLAQNSHVAFCAVAVTITLIAGQFDLSVGSLAGLTAMLTAIFTTKSGIPVVPALLLVVVIGAAGGLINGLLVTMGKINAFIVTLGVGSAYGGIALWVSGGSAVFEGFPQVLSDAGTKEIAGVPLPVIYILILLVVGWILTRRSVVGRYWYALGSNPESARLAGVKVSRHIVWAFITTGVLAAFAGAILVARFGSADPNTGPELLLPAFAAAFLGSSILSDGRFMVVGTIIATFFIAYAQNAMELMGLSPGVKPIFNGAVLVAAVGLSQQLRRTRGR